MMQTTWHKSTFSGPNSDNCVETRRDGTNVQVRDSKWGEQSAVLTFTPDEWDAFLAGARDGQFDVR